MPETAAAWKTLTRGGFGHPFLQCTVGISWLLSTEASPCIPYPVFLEKAAVTWKLLTITHLLCQWLPHLWTVEEPHGLSQCELKKSEVSDAEGTVHEDKDQVQCESIASRSTQNIHAALGVEWKNEMAKWEETSVLGKAVPPLNFLLSDLTILSNQEKHFHILKVCLFVFTFPSWLTQFDAHLPNWVLTGQAVKSYGRPLKKGDSWRLFAEPLSKPSVHTALLPEPRQPPASQKQGLYSCSTKHLIHETALQEFN